MSTLAMARLEWKRLLVRPFGWVMAAATLAWLAWGFSQSLNGFLQQQIRLAALPGAPGFTDLVAVPLLGQLAELAFLVVPLLAMSSLAGERRQGTLALLRGMGVAPGSIVLGKYLALLAWLVLWLALVLAMPLALAHAATLDWGKLAAAGLGTLLMLALLAALALLCSAFTAHPAVAAVLALVLGLAWWAINLGAQAAGLDDGLVNWLAMSHHVQPMWAGLVSSADVAWCLLGVGVCLALATRRVEAEGERG